MNQIELLAPAGDEECLRSALDYGCDAVYLAVKASECAPVQKTLTWTDSTALCVSRMNAA